MLTISLTANPPTAAQVLAERNALRRRERIVAAGIAMVFVASLVLYPAALFAMEMHLPPEMLVYLVIGAIALACLLLWRVGIIGTNLANLTPANALQMILLPELVQSSTVVRDYVARVASHQRPLLAAEFSAIGAYVRQLHAA